MNEPYRLRYTNQIVGAFLLILLLFVLSLLLILSGGYFRESDRYWLEVTQEDVDNLQKNAEVMILGERVGEVDDIRYVDGSDAIRIDLKMDPKKKVKILNNAIVKIERKFGFGTPVLIIRRGSGDDEAYPLPSGSQLRNFQGEDDRIDSTAREVESISRSVRLVQEKSDPTMESIQSASERIELAFDESVAPAMQSTQVAADAFKQTNDEIRPEALLTLSKLQMTTQNLDERVNQLSEKIERIIDEDMRDTLVKVRDSTDDVSDAADSVNQTSEKASTEISETLAQLQKAAEQFEKLAVEAREVVRIVKGEANDLPGTVGDINDTVDDTQNLVGEIRDHWLLRRYSRQPSATPQVSPSAIRGGSVR
ncbi:MlaD family protein [Neorhodopirellula pilleata]|uniref:Mce/MlaD domain-containing protein n=1 Tax=Neorhodopirellula pilleata TaxID=2714738 RepID=A0A5C6A838_9BACT|nr:MlaD family protein [Neorhodopirellula pilleata]TWT95699.1 hypothetical protein Pla100_33410 [Neorhodopirellula pilleata]